MEEGEGAPVRTTSAVSAGTATSDTAAVSQSLEGLMCAVDELKKSMGLGEQVDFAAVEQYIHSLRHENEEFRQFAEEAILSAQRLRDERDELHFRLEQSSLEQTMGAALAETQKLKDVADEFGKDLYQQKLAEAEARVAEVEGLRERIAELEDENAGLSQTLNEFRQTTLQLQKLQSHEVRRLQAVEQQQGQGGGGGGAGGAGLVPDGGSPKTASAGVGAAPMLRAGRSPNSSPKGAAPVAPVPLPVPAPSPQAVEASRIVEQLEEVSGGANSGLLASAAVALRQLSRRDAELVAAQQDNQRLRCEVDELNDTMFSKTFKPPSAWAEREIKYKSERKYWEEQQKEVAARLVVLTTELEAHRGASQAPQLEERIQELEARLLQSERERDSARAQLHELTLSMRTEGEFGNAGKRLSPYKGPLGVDASEGHEVQQMVDHLEQASIGTASPEVMGASAAAHRRHGMELQLQAAASENLLLRRQLQEQQMVDVPPSLQGELGQVATAAAVMSAAAGIEARLHEAETESQSLRQQLGGGGGREQQQAKEEGEEEAAAAAAGAATAEADMQVQELEARAQQAEAVGEEEEAATLRQQARQLQQLSQQLRLAEEEGQALRRQLQELRPVRLQISTAAAAAAAAAEQSTGAPAAAAADIDAEELPVPAALQAELGPTATAAAIEARAGEIEQRLGEAQQEVGELQQRLRQAVALEQAAQTAAQQQRVLEAQLDARQQRHEAAGPVAVEDAQQMEQLQQQLAAAQQQREAALQQLWQLAELQEALQKADANRRRLAAQLRQAQPVSLQLAVGGGDSGAAEQGELGPGSAELAQVQAELAEAQQQSSELRAQLLALQGAPAGEPRVQLALRVGADGGGGDAAATERLQLAEAEVERLRQQLADLQPVRMQLSLLGAGGSSSAGGSPWEVAGLPPSASRRTTRRSLDASASPGAAGELSLLAREASDGSMAGLAFGGDQAASELSMARAAADAAWREHQKASDLPSLLRAKAELETRCQMLESQLAKMQGELDHPEQGDLQAGRQSLGKRIFRRGQGKAAAGASPSKDTLKNTVHEMQDALTSSEEEKNALKRQLAKLSKKYAQVTQAAAHAAGIVAGAQAMQRAPEGGGGASDGEGDEEALTAAAAAIGNGQDKDEELELLKMREENQMLMEHVVMVKVRQAEMEGEYLEAKRQLARIREKNLALARKLADLREAAERGDPLPFTPRAGAGAGTGTGSAAGGGALGDGLAALSATPLRQNMASVGQEAVAAAAAGGPKSDRKSKLRIPRL